MLCYLPRDTHVSPKGMCALIASSRYLREKEMSMHNPRPPIDPSHQDSKVFLNDKIVH